MAQKIPYHEEKLRVNYSCPSLSTMLPESSSLPFNRRQFLSGIGASGAGLFLTQCRTLETDSTTTAVTLREPRLPWPVVFKGEQKFTNLCGEARRKNWASLPLPTRTVTVGKAICGTPYGNYTLEIDDKIENPSVNFETLDCWTFYETSLAFSRMIRNSPSLWSKKALLHYIELERYRDGQCNGSYISRMHHLEEVFANNEKRGLGTNITKSLGGVPVRRNVKEMQGAWKYYRYLRNDRSLIPEIAKVEAHVSALPVTYIPNARVASIESKLQDGDVIAIATKHHSSYSSHVGLAYRKGPYCHYMHATSVRSKGRCCIVDSRISEYLKQKSTNMGIMVFRPSEAPLIG